MIEWWWLLIAVLVGSISGLFTAALCSAGNFADLHEKIFLLEAENARLNDALKEINIEVEKEAMHIKKRRVK